MRRELALRGMGAAVVAMYVEDLGGKVARATSGRAVYVGSGWEIELVEGEKARIGSVQLGTTLVRIEGPEETVVEIEAALSRKALRAGG